MTRLKDALTGLIPIEDDSGEKLIFPDLKPCICCKHLVFKGDHYCGLKKKISIDYKRGTINVKYTKWASCERKSKLPWNCGPKGRHYEFNGHEKSPCAPVKFEKKKV